MDLVYGNFVRNICKKALGFWGVSLYQYDSLIIPIKNLVLITVYKLIIFFLKSFWYDWTKKTQELYYRRNKVARVIFRKTFQFMKHET